MKKMNKKELEEKREMLIYELDWNHLDIETERATINQLRKINTLIAIGSRR